MSLRVAVIGGSLCGLTTALLLRDLGHDVTVHERLPGELRARGAGIVVVEPTFRYLRERTGLDVDDCSTVVRGTLTLDRTGASRYEDRREHRFTSWSTLHATLRGLLDAEYYRGGCALVGLEPDDDEVVIHLDDGSRSAFDLVIGADGIRSTVRDHVLPGTPAVDCGYVAYRSAVPASRLEPRIADLVTDHLIYQVMEDGHALAYPIPGVGPDGSADELINLVWYRNVSGAALEDLLTDVDGRLQHTTIQPGAMRPVHVEEFHRAAVTTLAPQLAEVAGVAGEPFVQVVRDLEVPRMRHGRIVLMGDAAFAARPHTAAGTAKAADDAWALAEELGDGSDLDAALARWERRQLAVGRDLVHRARRLGDRSQFGGGWSVDEAGTHFGLVATA